ncbi:MAG: hypothetical protein ACI3XF_04170 [Eubacteriales bacterium]
MHSLFYINKKNPCALISVILMLAAAVIRIIYYTSGDMTPEILWIYLVDTVAAAVIFFIAVIFFGNTVPQLTVLPVAMGVGFFAFKALSFPSKVHTVLCLLLYTGVLVLYALTLFGVIRTKYLLYPLFGLPFLYHLFVEDTQKYFFASPAVPFFEWLPEISVLCIMAALFFISVSLEKRL